MITAALALGVLAVAAAAPEPASHLAPSTLEELSTKLNQAVAREARHEALPPRHWWSEDRASNRRAINQLLDEIGQLLLGEALEEHRARLRQLQESIQASQAQIVEYRQQLLTAPTEGSFWRYDRSDYEAAIAEAQAAIADHRRALAAQRRAMADTLGALGLTLDEEQLAFLLASVVGDDVIDLNVVADNARRFAQQLEQLLVQSEEDIQVAVRYYGMYTVMLKALERLHQQVIYTIDQRYLVQIETIIQQAQRLQQETQGLIAKQGSGQQQRVALLQSNLAAQDLTLRTARLYRDYLKAQVWEVEAARKQLLEDIAIADNTYQTATLSGELLRLLKASQMVLTQLKVQPVPILRPLQNLAIRQEFERLTQQLQQQP